MTKALEAYEKMNENQRNKYVKSLVKKQLAKQFNSFTSYGIFKASKALNWFIYSFTNYTFTNYTFPPRYTIKYIIGAPIVFNIAIEDFKSYREGFALNRQIMEQLGQEKIDEKYDLVGCEIDNPSIDKVTRVIVDKAAYEKIKAKKKIMQSYIENEKTCRNYMITDVQFENDGNRIVTYITVPSVSTAILEKSLFKEYELSEHIRYEILGNNSKAIEAEMNKEQELIADIVKRICSLTEDKDILEGLIKHFKLNVKTKDKYTDDIILEALWEIIETTENKLIEIMNNGDEAIKANREAFDLFEEAKISYRRQLASTQHKISSERKAFGKLRVYTDKDLYAKYKENRTETYY